MATYTQYYNLKKPESTDTSEIISDLNLNWDDIDTYLYQKADKVSGATAGNLASLDATGNLQDSGKSASDFALATDLTSHASATAQDDDVHGLKTLFQNQQFVNLIKNGDFASWSQGDNAAPDGWGMSHATVTKNDDGSLGHPYATVTTDASGSNADLFQSDTTSNLLSGLVEVVKAQKLTITCIAKVRTNSDKVRIVVADGLGGTYGDAHTGDGTWQTLVVQRTYNGSETNLGLAVRVSGSDNTTNISFDIGETILVIGELPVAFTNNPLDKALKAVDYQDTAGTNYEYGLITEQNGIGQINNGASTKAITFPNAFTKLLRIQITPIDSAEAIRAASGSTTGFTATRSGTTGNNKFYWSAVGVE